MKSDVALFRLLFDPRGRVGRAVFVLAGLVLGVVKVCLDYAVASFVFGRNWTAWNYLWSPSPFLRLTSGHDFTFEMTILTMAAPFAWMGICLCAKRLRAAALPPGLVVFFFIPILKWFFFALLATLPKREPASHVPEVVRRSTWDRFLPGSAFGSATVSVLVTVATTTCLVLLLARGAASYGATLFVGIPFFAGILSSVIYAARQPRSFNECAWPAFLSLLLTGAFLLAAATEGFVCLLMAAPLAICETAAGAFIGYLIMERRHKGRTAVFSVLSVLPLLFAVEKAPPPAPPPLRSVVTEVLVHAPIESVWQNVTGFPEIPPPRELIFRAGIACPQSAHIDGSGAGALRHCVFSTGEFVEPITVWDEPTRLAFDVTAQPDPLRELSPYGRLQTPHLQGYFRTEHGEFRLVRLGETTLLRGTTWYRLNYEPELYWSFWSDYIIHQIHRRVLEHVRACSEAVPY